MAHQTGENEQALRKILDLTRLIGIVMLIVYLYVTCLDIPLKLSM